MIEISSGDLAYIPNPHRIGQTSTVHDAIHLMSGLTCPHRLHPLDRHARTFNCVFSAVDLGECALFYVQYGFDVAIEVGCVKDYFLVEWPIAGEGYLHSGERCVVTSPHHVTITCPSETTEMRMTAQCRHLTARISRQAVETILAEKLGRRLQNELRFDLPIAADSAFARAWQRLLGHICQLSASAPEILDSVEMRHQYSRTMLELLLVHAPHNYTSALQANLDRSVPWYVRRAREYIKSHLPEIRSVSEIASHVGTSTRTLQLGFRQAYGKTPAEFLRRTRIHALYQSLLSAEPSQNVTALMENLGIVNFGRYARYYRQQFGETPSATLRRGMASGCD